MKSKLFSLAIALGALFTAGSAEATPSKTPNQQVNSAVTYSTTIENQLSPRSVSQAEFIDNDRPKPERKKPSTAGKIFSGFMVALAVTVVVFLLTVRGNE